MTEIEKAEIALAKARQEAAKKEKDKQRELNLIQYNADNTIVELKQHQLLGEDAKGLNLVIEGGDDGTDYEPYTTKYVLHAVNIDWLKVLYPIRTKLDSVRKTAAELEKLKEVYNTDNWDVDWFGNYDVTFDGATLNARTLSKVNNIIKKHLK